MIAYQFIKHVKNINQFVDMNVIHNANICTLYQADHMILNPC